MSGFVVLGLVILFVGFILGMIVAASEKPSSGSDWLGIMAFLVIGVVMAVGTVIGNAGTVNKIYQAAQKQQLAITTSRWGQHPSTTAPCHVKLRYDDKKKQLFLSGADTLATPEVLGVICK